MFQQKGYDFMAAAFEVYNELGSGWLRKSSNRASKSNFRSGRFRS
jgi:hypothetical protein